MDGRPHRLSNDGSNDKNVMYQFYPNQGGVPAGHITNFSRGGVAEKWVYPKSIYISKRTLKRWIWQKDKSRHAKATSPYQSQSQLPKSPNR
ncbi:hypothetical protein I6G26_00420 (plasmid) [Moraxella nonliquefaciens]|uniref:Uncharacterized protein n=1 Tax=Moraxella nonliquefaciens TaxID=478 RepID=A0A7T3EZQ4_MORNO|nr:hypothetical protein [Moraxella nonliquefaciens]QPT43589.1 hypothetical protein I6G26_00420 [Moraxella nonliquefaciens]